ncbi:hypothetical protein EXIGLDRAFT_734393 [Exidia glandulosa HHB12029]|uniref:Uncharacterized protein n=1 Tax=Exidia glandulosa HHB12029 TaxID=1314781 RepID=A0A165K7D5_EXIGL|nr:hypothetical protein EXIGLDRAFT_734393 [Exidia glandulosa HHB12029]
MRSDATTSSATGTSSPRLSGTTSVEETPAKAPKSSSDMDFLNTPFESFNPHLVSDQYDDDARKEPDYEKEITRQMLEVMLEFHAWASARPKHETVTHGEELSGDVNEIAQVEERQEQARLKLIQFVAQIKSAVLALTNFGLE